MAYSIEHHTRIKPKKESSFGKDSKPMKQTKMKPKRTTTDEESEYLNWQKEQEHTCFVCGTGMGIELHHVRRDSTSKKSHFRIIPLCFNHHTAGDFSAHKSPKKFREKYSMDIQEAYADSLYEEYELSNTINNT